MATNIAVWIRLSSAAVGGLVAVIGAAPPARPDWVTISATTFLVWAGTFAYIALKRGLSIPLVGVDVLVVVGICLVYGNVVPAGALASVAGTSWVDLIASTGVFVAHTGLRLAHGALATVIIAVAAAIGRSVVSEVPVVLVLQGVLAGGMMVLLRSGAEAADTALAKRAAAFVDAASRAAVRADERDQQRRLHDTVLATLTMIGTGAISRGSPILRVRAAEDLATVNQLRSYPDMEAGGSQCSRLDLALLAARSVPRPGLRQLDVDLDAPPIELPRQVTAGFADSVAEALTNVARHADTGSAVVRASDRPDGVVVEVIDSGRGFATDWIPPYRRGYRDSIAARMRAIGGDARITSREGVGTLVTLWWPHD
ncbi:sensor histidine kinase [Nonomuraea antimicrobica]|uniref:sensor histidine kinase n=1 Tax=Nonomuraea antimicrobica TaxID=561173 RepID=UPI0031EAF260